jgi:hypothetical protein
MSKLTYSKDFGLRRTYLPPCLSISRAQIDEKVGQKITHLANKKIAIIIHPCLDKIMVTIDKTIEDLMDTSEKWSE